MHAIEYYPLHGSVLTPEKGYNFNTLSIGTQGLIGYFKDLSCEIRKSSFLFWGYSCSDNNTITALYDNVNWIQTHQNKWILLLHEEDNEYFETLGFRIINGSTKDLLEYFQKNEEELVKNKSVTSINTRVDMVALNSYRIPSINTVPSFPLANFFIGQDPQWSHIFSNEIFKTKYYHDMENNINRGINTIIIGIPVSGKSTLLMQLAANFKTQKIKLFFDEMSLERAKFITKILKGQQALVFLDRICNDVDAIEFLYNYTNIQLVCAEREYNFQLVSHRLRKIFSNGICNISEIQEQDYKGIFDSIPNSLKKSNIINTGMEKDNLSMFEFISYNVRTEEIQSRLDAALKELTYADKDLLELFLMICYVNNCRTAVSYSMVYSYLNYEKFFNWQEVYERINQLGKLLKSVNYSFEWFDSDQDYYLPRSEYFSSVAINTIREGNPVFRNVIEKFHECISPLNIPNYNTFKRYAFDALIISKAYSKYEDGKEFYDKMFKRDSSPYLLQQASLYMKHKKRFKDAFFYIDKAVNMSPYNIFSIKNTHAQIIFAANIDLEDCILVRNTLDESMRILNECYEKDDRRIVHALIFADQAQMYFRKYGDEKSSEYIRLAKKWIKEEIQKNDWNKDLKRMSEKLEKLAS